MNSFQTLNTIDFSFFRVKFIIILTTQHVSGMRIFRDTKLCAFARNVPILEGLVLEIMLVDGVDGVNVRCSFIGLVIFGNVG